MLLQNKNKILVVIPTYNEKENIELLVPTLLAATEEVDLLVVDDNSPDGTATMVESFSQTSDRVHLLLRQKKQGLGKAYLAGFAWGLAQGYDWIVEMDADFSHRPEDLVKMLQQKEAADFIIGSRWVHGGATKNWGFGRILISRGGSIYARMILGYPVNDWTGGFNAWNRKVLEGIGLELVKSEGYSFQIELKYRALRAGFKGLEVPILFEDRRVGQSKMSSRIVFEALLRVWSFRFLHIKKPQLRS